MLPISRMFELCEKIGSALNPLFSSLLKNILWFIDCGKKLSAPSIELDSSLKNILVFRANHVGDLVLLTPFLRQLKRRFADAKLTIVVSPGQSAILARNPYVDEVIEVALPWGDCSKSIYFRIAMTAAFFLSGHFRRVFNGKRFDFSVDPSAHALTTLWARLLSIPYRAGVSSVSVSEPMLTKTIYHQPAAHVLDTFEKLTVALKGQIDNEGTQIFLAQNEFLDWVEKMRENKIEIPKRYVVFAPGAGWPPHKAWTPEGFSELGNIVQRELQTKVVVAGTQAEAHLTQQIAQSIPGALDLGGRVDLRGLLALIFGAELVVSNNSAAFHIAHAFNVPSVVICGGLYGGVEHQAKCWGYDEKCLFVGSEKKDCDLTCRSACADRACMKEVTPDRVMKTIRQLYVKRQ